MTDSITEELVSTPYYDEEPLYRNNDSNLLNYGDYYDQWDEADEEECPSCFGTGLDRDEMYDCPACYGEGFMPAVKI
jgi:hypothetical protein